MISPRLGQDLEGTKLGPAQDSLFHFWPRMNHRWNTDKERDGLPGVPIAMARNGPDGETQFTSRDSSARATQGRTPERDSHDRSGRLGAGPLDVQPSGHGTPSVRATPGREQ